jgi:hypothetical protein
LCLCIVICSSNLCIVMCFLVFLLVFRCCWCGLVLFCFSVIAGRVFWFRCRFLALVPSCWSRFCFARGGVFGPCFVFYPLEIAGGGVFGPCVFALVPSFMDCVI